MAYRLLSALTVVPALALLTGTAVAADVTYFQAISAAAGWCHTVAVQQDGTVWAWGCNTVGQLGDGTITSQETITQVKGLTSVTAVATGWLHSVALLADGTVWAWGANGSGQLGDGTTTSHNTPVQVQGISNIAAIAAGGSSSVALDKSGNVWTWGSNRWGQLGDGTNTNSTLPKQVAGLTNILSVATGGWHTVALQQDNKFTTTPIGTVWTWGDNTWGGNGNWQIASLNTDSYTPLQVKVLVNKPLTKIARIAAGDAHTVIQKSDGTVWAWGMNNYGQLGDGTTTNRPLPVQTKLLNDSQYITAGGWSTLAINNNGTVWGWGRNDVGQLGNGRTFASRVPVQTGGFGGVKMTAIAAGSWHTVAIDENKTLWAWGSNRYGQLGNGETTTRLIPVRVVAP